MKDILLENIDKIHTTKMGIDRIKRNLGISGDVITFCKEKIVDKNSKVEEIGKNYYVTIDDIKITINKYSFTIITTKKEKI